MPVAIDRFRFFLPSILHTLLGLNTFHAPRKLVETSEKTMYERSEKGVEKIKKMGSLSTLSQIALQQRCSAAAFRARPRTEKNHRGGGKAHQVSKEKREKREEMKNKEIGNGKEHFDLDIISIPLSI